MKPKKITLYAMHMDGNEDSANNVSFWREPVSIKDTSCKKCGGKCCGEEFLEPSRKPDFEVCEDALRLLPQLKGKGVVRLDITFTEAVALP